MEWFSYAVAVILLVASIVSPIITTYMNNKHQKELKRIDIYEDAKKEALSNFIDSAQVLNYNPADSDAMYEYCIAFDKLFIYFSDISLDTIKELELCPNKPSNFVFSEICSFERLHSSFKVLIASWMSCKLENWTHSMLL